MKKETAFKKFMDYWKENDFEIEVFDISVGGIWHKGCEVKVGNDDVRLSAAQKWVKERGWWRSVHWTIPPFIKVQDLAPGDVISMPIYVRCQTKDMNRYEKEWAKYVYRVVSVDHKSHVELLRLPGPKTAEVLYDVFRKFSRAELKALRNIPDGLSMEMSLKAARRIAKERQRFTALKLVV